METARITKEQFVDLLRTAGVTDEMMGALHRTFEARWPDAHQAFLQWLGIPAAEIAQIRAHAKA